VKVRFGVPRVASNRLSNAFHSIFYVVVGTWDHPCDGYYKRLYEEEKKKKETAMKESNDHRRTKAKQDVDQVASTSTHTLIYEPQCSVRVSMSTLIYSYVHLAYLCPKYLSIEADGKGGQEE
jgi:hypothetical protein